MCRSTAPPSADPPPITPLMPYFAINSKARGAALDRLPAFDRQPLRRRNQGDLLQRITAIRHLGRDRVVFSVVRERLALEGLEQDLDALLEHLAVGVLDDERGAEGPDFAGVITPASAPASMPRIRSALSIGIVV